MTMRNWNTSSRPYSSSSVQDGRYGLVAKILVDLAELTAGMRVVDLACGTGAVTAAIQARFGSGAIAVTGIDASFEMLTKAKAACDGTTRFVCATAETFATGVARPVDRVICNAAFWQFDMAAVLMEARTVLTPHGSIVVSLPSSRSGRTALNSGDLYGNSKLAWMILEERALRGWSRPGRKSGARRPSATVLPEIAIQCGFRISMCREVVVQSTPADTLAFIRVPAMLEHSPLFAGLTEDARLDILDVVAAECEFVKPTVSAKRWAVYTLSPTGTQHGDSSAHAAKRL